MWQFEVLNFKSQTMNSRLHSSITPGKNVSRKKTWTTCIHDISKSCVSTGNRYARELSFLFWKFGRSCIRKLVCALRFIIYCKHVPELPWTATGNRCALWEECLNQWFPNCFLSRRILEKTEIIWRTSNIWIKILFEFVIFSYPKVKSRQYCSSS